MKIVLVFAFVFLLSEFANANAVRYMPLSYEQRQIHIEAIKASMNNDIPQGYCGRGVHYVLTKLNFKDIQSADGHDWEKRLAEAGWKRLRVSEPEKAPPGTILVYLSDYRLHGKNIRGTKGGRWGHVEFVAIDGKGRRWYVSDEPRRNPGGTVKDNFTKNAWAPPCLSTTPIVQRVNPMSNESRIQRVSTLSDKSSSPSGIPR